MMKIGIKASENEVMAIALTIVDRKVNRLQRYVSSLPVEGEAITDQQAEDKHKAEQKLLNTQSLQMYLKELSGTYHD